MSSLHQDRPLAEDPKPTDGTSRIPAPAQGKTRTAAAATGEKAPNNVRTPRSGKTRSTTPQTTPTARRSTPTASTGTPAKRTTRARGAAAGSSSGAARTSRAAGAVQAVAAKTKTKTATAAPAEAATATAGEPAARTPAPSRKPATETATGAATKPGAEATAVEPVAATPAARKAVTAPVEAPGEMQRPTPFKRPAIAPETASAATVVLGADLVAADLVQSAETQAREVVAHVVPAAALSAAVADGRGGRSVRRRLSVLRRRPALFLAAALVGALGVSLTTGEAQPAQAETATVSQSVSVAEELGITLEAQPIDAITPEAATQRLGELVASRAERDEEQARAGLVQAEADRAAAEAAAAAAAEAARPKAVFPIQGARLTSGFGPRWGTMHNGLDLAAPMLTPEFAAADGIVLEAGPASGFGLAVYIQHDNGDVTVYGHMEEILVTAGQVVRAGDPIAGVGNRGQSTGPHLHFEVRSGGPAGSVLDPVAWLAERGVQM